MPEFVSIEGPIELVDGELCLLIPVEAGGAELAESTHGIGEIVGDLLVIKVPGWMAQRFRIGEGSLVVVDNKDGKFTLTRSARNGPWSGSAA